MGGGLQRHGWLLVLPVGVGLFLLDERAMVATGNPNFVPSAVLLGASVVPLTFVTFVKGRHLPFTVSGGLLAAAALIGGVLGTIVAGTLEYDVTQRLGGLPILAVALIEESAKLVVPLVMLLALRRRLGVADGLLLGVACGAGFAALETMGYGFDALLTSRGSVAGTVDLLMVRGLVSPAGHMAWSGITAAAMFAVPGARHRGRALLWFVLAFAVAVSLHALWDGLGGVATYVVLAVLSLGLLTAIAHLISHRIAHPTAHRTARCSHSPGPTGDPAGAPGPGDVHR